MTDDISSILGPKDEVTLLREHVEEIALALANKFESRLQEVEKVVEDVEKQIATLIIGYGEQAVFMEALIAQLAFSSPEAQAAFTANVSENRRKMFQAMKEGAPGILGPENEDLASAITNLADQKLSDSN
jgi:hypothetical protein